MPRPHPPSRTVDTKDKALATIDLNSDGGESFGNWTFGDGVRIIESADSTNVACGFHSGDATTIRATVPAAQRDDVVIGATPNGTGVCRAQPSAGVIMGGPNGRSFADFIQPADSPASEQAEECRPHRQWDTMDADPDFDQSVSTTTPIPASTPSTIRGAARLAAIDTTGAENPTENQPYSAA